MNQDLTAITQADGLADVYYRIAVAFADDETTMLTEEWFMSLADMWADVAATLAVGF